MTRQKLMTPPKCYGKTKLENGRMGNVTIAARVCKHMDPAKAVVE